MNYLTQGLVMHVTLSYNSTMKTYRHWAHEKLKFALKHTLNKHQVLSKNMTEGTLP